MKFGRYFEEFEIGDVYDHGLGRTITEADDMWFSLMTMNHNPLHINAHYMESHQYGRRLTNGLLVFSIAVGLSVADVSGLAIANLEYDEVKHLAPTFYGDTIYARTRVLGKRESRRKPDRGIVEVETWATNQRGEKVLTFRRKVLVPKKSVSEGRGQTGRSGDRPGTEKRAGEGEA